MIEFSDMNFAAQPINRSKKKIISKSALNDPLPTIKKVNVGNCQDLSEFYQIVNSINHPLKDTCKSTVIFSGDSNSPLMIVGEAPGALEDEQALTFVGDSGKLLNKILEEVGIDRQKVYVTNIVFFKPPENRKPTTEEIDFFWPFLQKHIELQKPRIILVLGATAATKFSNKSITKARGTFENYENIPVLFSFHPSYLLRTNTMLAIAKKDFEVLKEFLVSKELFKEVSL